MKRFICLGINYRNTPVEARERVAIARDDMQSFLQSLCGGGCIREAFVVSTCNRTEVYLVGERNVDEERLIDSFTTISIRERGGALTDEKGLYTFRGRDAVEHLFKVASSLDSMVVGEPQILGQVKDGWKEAEEAEAGGTFLHRLVSRAFKTAKRVRTETEIASGAVSISYVAVQLAKRVFSDFSNCKVLVLGAGEMAELTALHLHENGVKSVCVANRSLPRARELADQYGWRSETLDKITELLGDADIVVASTGSPTPVLGLGTLKNALSRRQFRPLFLVDIALPRDIEPAAGELDGVYLYNVDDLEVMASQNRVERQHELQAANRIVAEEVMAFSRWLSSFSVTPTIAGLKQKLMDIRDDELERSGRMLETLTPSQREGVERLLDSMVKKVLHGPASAMREQAKNGRAENLVAAIQESFDLKELGLIDGPDDSLTWDLKRPGTSEEAETKPINIDGKDKPQGGIK